MLLGLSQGAYNGDSVTREFHDRMIHDEQACKADYTPDFVGVSQLEITLEVVCIDTKRRFERAICHRYH